MTEMSIQLPPTSAPAPASAPTPTIEAEALCLDSFAAADEQVHLDTLEADRLRRAKFAYTTRAAAARAHAGEEPMYLLSGPSVRPRSGDIVLARIVTVGQHRRIETPSSRRATLFPGDEVVLAYGNRYAADQFHAVVPENLGPAHMVAAGGVAGHVVEQHAGIDEATVIEPLGLLSTKHGRLTLEGVSPLRVDPDDTSTPGRPPVIAVFGTSMNSGKSTTAAHLVHGLTAAGHQVGAGKVTGTGAGNDTHLYTDAGAAEVLDFTDFGFSSTFMLDSSGIRSLVTGHIRELTAAGASAIVLEIADGLYQAETRRLLDDPVFAAAVDTVVFSAHDALGAAAGVDLLASHGVPVACVSGLLTASPLATAEARASLEVPVAPTLELGEAPLALQVTGLDARGQGQ